MRNIWVWGAAGLVGLAMCVGPVGRETGAGGVIDVVAGGAEPASVMTNEPTVVTFHVTTGVAATQATFQLYLPDDATLVDVTGFPGEFTQDGLIWDRRAGAGFAPMDFTVSATINFANCGSGHQVTLNGTLYGQSSGGCGGLPTYLGSSVDTVFVSVSCESCAGIEPGLDLGPINPNPVRVGDIVRVTFHATLDKRDDSNAEFVPDLDLGDGHYPDNPGNLDTLQTKITYSGQNTGSVSADIVVPVVFDTPGDHVVTCRVTAIWGDQAPFCAADAPKQPNPPKQQVVKVEAKLPEVQWASFKQATGWEEREGITVYRDLDSLPYATEDENRMIRFNEWEAGSRHPAPGAFVRKNRKRVNIAAQFKGTAGETWEVQGKLSNGAILPVATITFVGDRGLAIADFPLPYVLDAVMTVEDTITWEYRKAAANPGNFVADSEQTPIRIYVTADKRVPAADEVELESYFYVACKEPGAKTKAKAEESVWRYFSRLSVETADGNKPTFWGPSAEKSDDGRPAPGDSDSSQLVKYGNGNAWAWVALFEHALNLHGIQDVKPIRIFVKREGLKFPKVEYVHIQDPPGQMREAAVGMLFKDFLFNTDGSLRNPKHPDAVFFWYNPQAVANASRNFEQLRQKDWAAPEVVRFGGLPAQNNNQAIGYWYEHILLVREATDNGPPEVWYDPSYGLSAKTLRKYQTLAIGDGSEILLEGGYFQIFDVFTPPGDDFGYGAAHAEPGKHLNSAAAVRPQ